MGKAKIEVPLDIPDVQVLNTQITDQGEFVITLESTLKHTFCRQCGQKITQFHGYDEWVTVRHLSILGRPVYVRYRPKRYRCSDCEGKPTTTQRLAWHEANSPHTKAYDEYVLVRMVNNTVQDVSFQEGMSYDRVLGVIERRVASQPDWTCYPALEVIGVDEIALKKGHRDFVVIISARLSEGRVALLGVLPDRKKETVKAFINHIPAALRATIQTVCCDLYESYLQAVRETLPQAHLVIDRFHVAQQYRAAVDHLRKTELKRLKKELPKADYRRLKGHLAAFRKPPTNLTAEQQAVLDYFFTLSPQLKEAYRLREALTAIFQQAPSKEAAQTQLRAWQTQVRRSGLSCFDRFLATLNQWWNEITHYFVDRATSGFVEGFNNKLKVLKRRCYGLFNLKHFFQRAFLDLEGYQLWA